MILVFGGTTEGKQVIEVLSALQLPFVYSTKTKIKAEVGSFGIYRSGAFSKEELDVFIQKNKIKIIIHASHPFAEVLHKTIEASAIENKIPVYRLQRVYPERKVDKSILYVKDYQDLEILLKKTFSKTKALFLTGVQTIERLTYFWRLQTSFFRILDRQLSINIALKSNFPKEQLILGMPSKNVEEEIALIHKLNVGLLITKESGESGALSVKIKAAKECNIPIIIIEKPVLPTYFSLFSTTEKLQKALQELAL